MRTESGVIDALETMTGWPVDMETSGLTVTIEHGIVALAGQMRWRLGPSKTACVLAQGMASGDDVLRLHALLEFKRIDVEIGCNAALAVQRTLPCSCDCVRLTVRDAQLTLAGALEWSYQQERIDDAIKTVAGITRFSDATHVCSHIDPIRIADRVREGLRLSTASDSRQHSLETDHDATKGDLRSWALGDPSQHAS